MRKPLELRNYLLASVRELDNNPDRLQVFIDRGDIKCNMQGTTLHFEYEYTLNLIITDFGGHPDNVFVPILAWAKAGQPELDKDAIKFNADILSKELVDLSIEIPLSERVIVTQGEDGNYTTHHPAEPQPDWTLPNPALFKELWRYTEKLTPDE